VTVGPLDAVVLHAEGRQVPHQRALPRARQDLEQRVLRGTFDRVDTPAGAGHHPVGAGARAPATHWAVAVVHDLQRGVVEDVDAVVFHHAPPFHSRTPPSVERRRHDAVVPEGHTPAGRPSAHLEVGPIAPGVAGSSGLFVDGDGELPTPRRRRRTWPPSPAARRAGEATVADA
jgi:hypothetical protein